MKQMIFLFLFVALLAQADCLRPSRSTVSMMASKYLGSSPVFVAGGSRGVGFEVVKQLSSLGTPVHALVRQLSSGEELLKLPGVKVFIGDAIDEAAVQKAMEGTIAAITTLGGTSTDGASRVDYVGNSNVVEQVPEFVTMHDNLFFTTPKFCEKAGILGVERIILVTRFVLEIKKGNPVL